MELALRMSHDLASFNRSRLTHGQRERIPQCRRRVKIWNASRICVSSIVSKTVQMSQANDDDDGDDDEWQHTDMVHNNTCTLNSITEIIIIQVSIVPARQDCQPVAMCLVPPI